MKLKLFGLTGGIGMGKSTAATLLEELGAVVVDTDTIARNIVEPGQPALEELKEIFGPSIVGADGRLKRKDLAERVFADPEARARLESILHPRIRAAWLNRVAVWRHEEREVGVVVIPLLFETSASNQFDATICIACSAATQRERLRQRGWTPDQTAGRLQAQLPIERKMLLSDYVVWTEGSLEVHREQLRRIVNSPVRS